MTKQEIINKINELKATLATLEDELHTNERHSYSDFSDKEKEDIRSLIYNYLCGCTDDSYLYDLFEGYYPQAIENITDNFSEVLTNNCTNYVEVYKLGANGVYDSNASWWDYSSESSANSLSELLTTSDIYNLIDAMLDTDIHSIPFEIYGIIKYHCNINNIELE